MLQLGCMEKPESGIRVYEILEEKFCAVRKKCDSKKYNNNKLI